MSYFNEVIISDPIINTIKTSLGIINGEIRVAEHYRLVGTTFVGNTMDTNFWNTASASGGSVSQSGGQVILRTGNTANGSSRLFSVRNARYVGSYSNYCRILMRTDNTGLVNNIRRWGAFNTTSGCFYQLSGTALGIVTRKNSVDTIIDSSSWNGQVFSMDTDLHVYEIHWTNSKIYFIIDNILRHVINSSITTWTDNIHLPIEFNNINSSNQDGDIQMEIRVATINRIGKSNTTSIYRNISTNTISVLKYGPGILHRIVFNKTAGNNSTLTIYDNTSNTGSVIGTINSNNINLTVLEYMVDFFTGLTIVTAGGTAPDVTVVYE